MGLNLYPYIRLGPRGRCESVDLKANATGKDGIWLTKPPGAESADWGRLPESAGKAPHLSGARGVRRWFREFGFRFRNCRQSLSQFFEGHSTFSEQKTDKYERPFH
jgi:hypothetical protein